MEDHSNVLSLPARRTPEATNLSHGSSLNRVLGIATTIGAATVAVLLMAADNQIRQSVICDRLSAGKSMAGIDRAYFGPTVDEEASYCNHTFDSGMTPASAAKGLVASAQDGVYVEKAILADAKAVLVQQ